MWIMALYVVVQYASLDIVLVFYCLSKYEGSCHTREFLDKNIIYLNLFKYTIDCVNRTEQIFLLNPKLTENIPKSISSTLFIVHTFLIIFYSKNFSKGFGISLTLQHM